MMRGVVQVGSVIQSLESRRLLAGITLITHGLQTDGTYPQWVDQMALAVDKRIEPAATSPWTNVSLYRMVMTGNVTVQSFTLASGPLPSASKTGEIVIALNWASISGLSGPSTGTVATAVVNQLLASGPALGFGGELMSLPIQLIGHSRGGSLIADLARQLGQHGIWVDQVTTLDAFPIGSDASTTLYDNVVFADNYYETHDFIVHGSAVTGSHNVGPLSLPGGSSLDHSDTHTFYDGTIDRGAATDGDVNINTAWWTSTTQRATIGYDFSRISGGARPADGLGAIGGGSASRTHVALTTSPWDNVGSPSIGGADANGFIANGAMMNLNYRYQDSAGGGTVAFYLDNDTNPYDGFTKSLASNTSLAATGAQPASSTSIASTSWTSIGLISGAYYVYATITDAGSAHTRLLYDSQPIFVTASGTDLVSKRWSNDTASNDWNDPRNWSPGGVPAASSVVWSNFGATASTSAIAGISLDLDGSAVATFSTTQHLHAINLAGASDLVELAGANAIIVTSEVSIAGSATLDLNNNDMLVDYTGSSSLASIQSLINSGRAGGAWNGSGITSSSARNTSPKITTLGAMEASDYKSIYGAGATFDGEAIDNSAVLVKYTYYGDTNFNGEVDGSDYAKIDTIYGSEHTAGNIGGWFNGDFNGDGKIDGSDYGLIDAAFASQGLPIRPPALLPAMRSTTTRLSAALF